MFVGRSVGKDAMLTSGVIDLEIGCMGRIGCSIEDACGPSFKVFVDIFVVVLIGLLVVFVVDHENVGACCAGFCAAA